MTAYRSDLPPLPERLRHLDLDDRGYPIPWFVARIKGRKPDIRFADSWRRSEALALGKCWVCGYTIAPENPAFVIGPMCLVNRVSAEPPTHLECAEYSVKACPFLAKPKMVRRENDRPENPAQLPGHAIMRNPGVALIYVPKSFVLEPDGRGEYLFRLGEPLSLSFWAEGRPATRDEIEESIRTGMPILATQCDEQPGNRLEDLERMHAAAKLLLPA